MAIYPQVARALLERCEEYKKRRVTLSEFKSEVWGAAQDIVAAEENAIHEFLKNAEARLDMVEYTIGGPRVFEETLPIVEQIETQLRHYLET